MTKSLISRDVVIIGGGPSGALAAALLMQQGVDVIVLERQQFPRFVIGESLLAQSMEFIEKAGFMDAVQAAGFQKKDGAVFSYREQTAAIDFETKSAPGWGTTFQVQRSRFDKLLADEATRQGADIRYGWTVNKVTLHGSSAEICATSADGENLDINCRFVLDASGYGRVLPRLLGLERPSSFRAAGLVYTCH